MPAEDVGASFVLWLAAVGEACSRPSTVMLRGVCEPVCDPAWHYWGTVSSTARKFMRWTGKALLWLVVALLVLAVSGAIYQAIATERAERAYPPPGKMVDVGGHSLHINCVGRGSPTVILDGGTGEMSANWVLVQREVSDTTRVCAYDRAGMGWSEMGPEPRDATQITGELHALLEGAGIEGLT